MKTIEKCWSRSFLRTDVLSSKYKVVRKKIFLKKEVKSNEALSDLQS